MIETIMTNKKVEEITYVTCDKCGIIYSASDDLEIQEFLHIDFVGGYNSVFGDMIKVHCDICQHCLKEMIGDICQHTDYWGVE
jgi:hypothetical protein